MEDESTTKAFPEGSVFFQWESCLEKLKILNYETKFVSQRKRKPFTRVHFVIPGKNLSHQFDDFIDICSWLLNEITNTTDFLKREQFDDPSTTINKLLLSLKQVDFPALFPVQKLKTPHGEIVCTILEYLTDKALEKRGFKWLKPNYNSLNETEQSPDEDNENSDVEDTLNIPEDSNDGDDIYRKTQELGGTQATDEGTGGNSKDPFNTVLLQGIINPSEWNIEVERVAPRLKALKTHLKNEWRSHVVQVVENAIKIDKVLLTTKSDVASTKRNLQDETSRIQSREITLNSQFPAMNLQFKEIKLQLDEYIKSSKLLSESLFQYSNDLSEVTDKIEELKEEADSKDAGANDTSPLIRIKAALQQIKTEIMNYDLRIGVVSNSLMTAKHTAIKSLRAQMVTNNKHKNKKNLNRRVRSTLNHEDSQNSLDYDE